MPENEHDRFDRLIASYLRASALNGPDHARIGPFVASFDPHSDSPYLSYAVPEDMTEPDLAQIAALIEAFEQRGRTARLEYVPGAAPGVEAALLDMGFTAEARYPLMAAKAVVPVDIPGIEMRLAQSDDDIIQAANSSAAAYGEDTVDARSLKEMVERGALLALAVTGNMVVGTAMANAAQNGVIEIAGIGVIDAFRRRGIAGAITSFVTAQAFAGGATLAWLTPGHAAAERVYARAGFVRASEQLHISKSI